MWWGALHDSVWLSNLRGSSLARIFDLLNLDSDNTS